MILQKLKTTLIFILPATLFFGYYPVISLGADNSMNFELSLPLLWLLLFTIISLPDFFQEFLRALSRPKRPSSQILLAACLFAVYTTVSIIWSPNSLRALLTAGIANCLLVSIVATTRSYKIFTECQRHRLILAILGASVIFALFCWIQCILDLLGLDPSTTLLCAGCTYQSFGFPHPNGLAIEPQFMGNLLITPTLLALYLICRPKISRPHKGIIVLVAFFLSATLFLTFSRGAIYAFVLAFTFLAFYLLKKRQLKPILLVVPIVAFLFTLTAQGLFAQISPTTDTFLTAETKAIHHLSLGKIDLRASSIEVNPTPSSNTAIFDGYVTESTAIRLSLSNMAVNFWQNSPNTIIFGVGLGGAGTLLHQTYPNQISTAKEIIQNQYISILLELGLLGLLLAMAVLFFVLRYFYYSAAAPLLFATSLAYAISLFFFAGLPNALQVYLFPPLLVVLFRNPNQS